MVVELSCWIAGVGLILTYLAVNTGLESQRQHGIELFTQARAVELGNQHKETQYLTRQSVIVTDRENPAAAPVQAVSDQTNAVSLPIAVLRMASVGLEVPVYADISELNLSRGAGWIGGTAPPNIGGNMAVAAHRDRYFRSLKDVQIGDTLELESLSGHGEFRVSRIFIVEPEDVSVLDDTTVPTVTLVTCYPFYFLGNAPQRYIVQAIAVEHSGTPPSNGSIPATPPSGEIP